MKLPQVDCRYGAPMGRASRPNPYIDAPVDALAPHRMHLRRVRLDSGGYDEGGAYWGIGQPLWWYFSHDNAIDGFLRAPSREDARCRVLEMYPNAKFYR